MERAVRQRAEHRLGVFVLRVVKDFERYGGLEVVDVKLFEHHGGLELNELRGAEDLEGRMDFVSLFNRGDLEEASELGEEGFRRRLL